MDADAEVAVLTQLNRFWDLYWINMILNTFLRNLLCDLTPASCPRCEQQVAKNFKEKKIIKKDMVIFGGFG